LIFESILFNFIKKIPNISAFKIGVDAKKKKLYSLFAF